MRLSQGHKLRLLLRRIRRGSLVLSVLIIVMLVFGAAREIYLLFLLTARLNDD